MWGGRYWAGRYFGGRFWGKQGLTVPGYFWSGRYFASRYWGLRYWGKAETSVPFEIEQTAGISLTGTLLTSGSAAFGTPFEIVQTSGVSLAGSLAITGNLEYTNEDWAITPPLEVRGLVGTLSIACDLVFGGPVAVPSGGYWSRKYWGGAYFGQRYWGTGASFAITQTAGVGLTGTLSTTAGIAQTLGITPSTLGLTGTLTAASGNLSFVSFNYTSAGVLYIPVRMVSALWSGGNVGAAPGEVAWLPPARQQMVYTDSRTGQVFCDPAWYRFFEYIAETRLAGKTGPTLTAVVQTLTATQETSAAAAAVVTEIQQQTQANAESLFVVREVVRNNSLTGAGQIPQVEL